MKIFQYSHLIYFILQCSAFVSHSQERDGKLTMDSLEGIYQKAGDDVYYIRFQDNSITYYLPEANNEVTVYEYPCGFIDDTVTDSVKISDLDRSGTRLVVVTDYSSYKTYYNLSEDCNVYTVIRNEGGTIELEGQNLFIFIPIQNLPIVLEQSINPKEEP